MTFETERNTLPEALAILDQLIQLEGVVDGVLDRVLQHRVDTVAGSPLICPIATRTLCALPRRSRPFGFAYSRQAEVGYARLGDGISNEHRRAAERDHVQRLPVAQRQCVDALGKALSGHHAFLIVDLLPGGVVAWVQVFHSVGYPVRLLSHQRRYKRTFGETARRTAPRVGDGRRHQFSRFPQWPTWARRARPIDFSLTAILTATNSLRCWLHGG